MQFCWLTGDDSLCHDLSMKLTKAGNPRKRPARPGEGRPDKYKPEYCQMIIEHGKTGLSYECFAGKVGITRDRLYEWLEDYPEFRDAKNLCQENSRAFWEDKSVEALKEQNEYNEQGKLISSSRINPTVLIFNLKNRFRSQWQDQTHTVVNSTVVNKDPKEVTRLQNQVKSLVDELKSRKTKHKNK